MIRVPAAGYLSTHPVFSVISATALLLAGGLTLASPALAATGQTAQARTSAAARTAIPVGGRADAIAITPNGKAVYVCNFNSRSLTPISTATNKAGPSIALATSPLTLAITPDGSTVYAAGEDGGSGTVVPVSTATNTAGAGPPIKVRSKPFSMAITPDGKTLFVVNSGAGDVSAIATATQSVLATLRTGPGSTASSSSAS